jgi:hypothetical protein
LTGLTDNTTYYFHVRSTDSSGNGPTISSEMTFTTGSAPTQIIIDDGDIGTSSSGSWNIRYGANSYNDRYLFNNTGGATYTFQTSADGTYELSLWWTFYADRCTNIPIEIYDGNSLLTTINVNQQINDGQWNILGTHAFSGTAIVIIGSEAGCSTCADALRLVHINTPTDSTPPVISNIQVTSVSDTTAEVTWTTDEPSDSIVQYGTTSGSYPSSENSPNLVTSHSITLTGLTDNTTYYFRVGSTDGSGNGPTISSESGFTTNPALDTTAPTISNVQVTSITQTTATISWTTNEPSDSEVQYDSASRLWGSYPWGENDNNLVTSHSIILTGLEADTTYYFRVGSTDGSGNGPTTSNQMTFTTGASPVPPNAPTRLKIIRSQ